MHSCGNCLGSGCSGSPGYTDPDCPQHGTAAQAAAKAEMEAQVASLNTASLRKLARRRKPVSEEYWSLGLHQLNATAPLAIRRASEQMVRLAAGGIRRLKLFTTDADGRRERREPKLNELERRVVRHFARRVKIVYRTVWKGDRGNECDVWAVW